MNKKTSLSTEIFRGKTTPDFVKSHNIFKTPTKLSKIFPSIGLPNFKEKANIDKCMIDVKKEGTYVHNLLRHMSLIATAAKDDVALMADKIQYLETTDSREKQREKITEFYNISNILTKIATLTDPYNQEVLENTIQMSEGRIELKLIKDILDVSGKPIFRKDLSLFRVFNRMREKVIALGLQFQNLEQAEQFKTFSKENIPNKEFSVFFSSEGEEGAWDLLTMSMRGIKSCQRWDGDYPRCLIGSVLSKFVGIIYLTSGVQSEPVAGFSGLGTKMMRRCVVRYAVDADEKKPCILIDKMYPDLDKDILNIFTNAIKSKTQIPIHYSPDLGNKIRHMYIPSESIRDTVSDRDWSYQDAPLKSKNDFNVYIFSHNKEEIEREIRGFRVNLTLFMARRMEEIYSGSKRIEDVDIKKIISNIRMNIAFTPFCENITNSFLKYFRIPSSREFKDSKSYYRKYIMEMLTKRKTLVRGLQDECNVLLMSSTSRNYDPVSFSKYIMSVIMEFAKLEAVRTIN